MTAPSGDPAAYELAFVEGRRTLDQQAQTLNEARERIGTLVSAAAVIAGLGASLAFNNAERVNRLDWWGGTATATAAVALGLAVLAAARIWWPFSGVFVLSSETIVGDYIEGDPPALLPEVHRELAVHLGRNAERNAAGIDTRLRWFAVALVAFVIEVAALLVVLLDVA